MTLTPGITPSTDGIDGVAWNVVGHTYTPKLLSETAFLWHAVIPADTFVPPHIHPLQDEWIYMLEGELEIEFGEEKHVAGPGDMVRMPMGVAHGIFNRSGETASCTFGVAPSGKLFDLFGKLHNVTDPAELVRISAEHDVNFLPPPGEG
jgi:quercetin dioxygenase-like cupin family protein